MTTKSPVPLAKCPWPLCRAVFYEVAGQMQSADHTGDCPYREQVKVAQRV
ncbi:MAG TPA: hypothetical protein VKI00_25685 [Mycobacterium sp.]|nr:hypothetical protein [Mycobacterium sp.]HME78921.1 hypothetical protein [Mycobacterium sp.]